MVDEEKEIKKRSRKERIKEKLKAHFPHKFAKEFMHFLKEYKIIGLAIAFIIGVASNQLIKSLVDNIVMPLITPFIPGGAWKEAILQIGPFAISWGKFVSDFIYFIIVALVVFIIVKKIIKEEEVTKK